MTASIDNPDNSEFVISRVFEAPRRLVWDVWTQPEHISRWWGPKHSRCVSCELDLRAGGSYRFVDLSPDGKEYPLKGVVVEIQEFERLVTTMDFSEMDDAWHAAWNPKRPEDPNSTAFTLVSTVTFADSDGKTTVTVRHRFESSSVRNEPLMAGFAGGWSESLERFAAELALCGG